jgi:PAS domain S-box-containing protein
VALHFLGPMTYDPAIALGALLRSTRDYIFFHDREGRYRYVSDAAAASLGRTAESMIGLTTTDLGIPEHLSADFHAQRREVMATRRPHRGRTSYGELLLDYEITPLVVNDELLGTIVITHDVTEQQRATAALRESETKFSIAFARSPLALTITSVADGTLVDVNEGFVQLSGYTREEAVGRTPDALGLWVDPEVRAERFRRMRAGERVPDIEARFRIKNGQELIGVVGSALVEINGSACVLSSVIDITDRKHAEEAKDEFLATLSHELRTPLTAAYGWVKLLGRTQDPELVETGLRAIEESLVTQIRLIDDLLDVSRIAAGKTTVDLQPLELADAVHSAIEMVRPAAEAKQIAIAVDTQASTFVLGDAARLQQVVANLLSNAVKFTPAGGAVDVALRQRDGNAEVVIRDTGDGIAAEFLPHVFDRFRQADSSMSRRHGGLGIGLTIVASLVEAHHGSVRAESDGPGHGSTFTVTLPLLWSGGLQPADGARRAEARRSTEADLAGARVLVVDDDHATRRIVIAALTAAGAEVRECASAGEAFDTLAAWRPNVLISDLAMPQEDGYSLLRRIRASGELVPAVAITAYARSEDEARVRDAGFQRHMAKPFDPEELVRTVRELV